MCVSFNCPSQETEETSRPIENVLLTTKGLQERNTQVLDGTTVKNRENNKLILTEIFPSVHETWYLNVLIHTYFNIYIFQHRQ